MLLFLEVFVVSFWFVQRCIGAALFLPVQSMITCCLQDADQAGSGEVHLLSAPSSTLSNAGLHGVPAAVQSDAEPYDCTPAKNKVAATLQHVTALHSPVSLELGTQQAVCYTIGADSRGLSQSVSGATRTNVPEQSASVHAIDTVSLHSKRGLHDEPGSSQSENTEHMASKRSRLQIEAEQRQVFLKSSSSFAVRHNYTNGIPCTSLLLSCCKFWLYL